MNLKTATSIIFISIILFLETCNAQKNKEEVRQFPESEILIQAREEYKGDPSSAIKTLQKLSGSFKSGYFAPVILYGLEICMDTSVRHEIRKECEAFFSSARSGFSEKYKWAVLEISSAYYLSDALYVANEHRDTANVEACSLMEKTVAGFAKIIRDSKQEKKPLYEAIESYCLGNFEVSEKNFLEAKDSYQNNSTDFVEISSIIDSYLLALSKNKKTAAFSYQGNLYLRNYKHRELNSFLENSKSGYGTSSEWKLLYAALINPFSGLSPFSRNKPHKTMEVLITEATKSLGADCKLSGCKILLSEAERLLGEIFFTRGETQKAEKHFEACISIWKYKKDCYEGLLLTGMSGGKSAEKYSGEIYSKMNDSYLFREEKNLRVSEKESFLSISAKSRIPLLKSVKYSKKLKTIADKIVKNPYLRGKFPFEVEVHAADYNNAEAHFIQGKGYIYIGKKLMDEILIGIREGNFRSETKEEDVLAAIIGHELHHLAGGHGLETCTVKNYPDEYKIIQRNNFGNESIEFRESNRSELWRKEFEADEMGMFYAFLSGYRAQGFLSVLEYWNQKEGTQPITKDAHPPFLIRLVVLSKKIKVLQIAAQSFSRASVLLKEVEKEFSDVGASKKSGIKEKLLAAEEHLSRAESILPGEPSIAINRSYMLLRSSSYEIQSPELPTSPIIENHPGFIPPIAGKEVYGIAESDEKRIYHTLNKYRKSLKENPFLKEGSPKKLLKVVDILDKAKYKFPENGKIANNLALAEYGLAEREIRNYLATGKWKDKKTVALRLKKAEKLLVEALDKDTSETHKIKQNLASVRFAFLHLDESEFQKKLEEVVSGFMGKQGTKQFIEYLQSESTSDSSYILPPFQSVHEAFLIGYLSVYYLADQEKAAEIIGNREHIPILRSKTLHILNQLVPAGNTSGSYWIKELYSMKNFILLEGKNEKKI